MILSFFPLAPAYKLCVSVSLGGLGEDSVCGIWSPMSVAGLKRAEYYVCEQAERSPLWCHSRALIPAFPRFFFPRHRCESCYAERHEGDRRLRVRCESGCFSYCGSEGMGFDPHSTNQSKVRWFARSTNCAIERCRWKCVEMKRLYCDLHYIYNVKINFSELFIFFRHNEHSHSQRTESIQRNVWTWSFHLNLRLCNYDKLALIMLNQGVKSL